MAKTKIDVELAVAKMRTAIDGFGEGLDKSGIQWESYKMDDNVRAVYSLCHATVCDLGAALENLH